MTTTVNQTIPAVGKYVDTQHVDEVIRTYKKERWIHNTERIGKEDSLTVWYTIDEMEAFLEKAKKSGANGIKMCFAAYPDDFEKVPEYAGRQTIVMVATKSTLDEVGINHKDVYVNNGNKAQIMAYNVGRLCPPSCSGSGNGGIGDGEWGGLGLTILEQKDKSIIVV